ncbi:uncharacterized protein CC84DRAFT_1219872 [Paraphaeosphaeria sporulosa]|uniref:Uncharacterized protein n=1 Tax=Paraphaeosphaeria sporulosa TaxID=1460663 RepID=A0A177C5B2_9PLEO|nr:uncharacterized protein CC84DRAFT_1219872 [Paraphaeosphaeria sporulosa]OAG02944.1 hypothetical protein CC84DRAFT_1219872 [Paraphaeosphaeria sporulosa]
MYLGALTTAFVPAPGCIDTIYGEIFSVGTVRDKWHSLGQSDKRSCYPSAFTTPGKYYSPGICPSAWSSAHTSYVFRHKGNANGGMHSGYICASSQTSSSDTFSCSRLYTDPPKITVPQEINGKTTYMETTLAADGGLFVVYANQIEVRFQKGTSRLRHR